MTEQACDYKFEDIEVGQKKQFKLTITVSMVSDFAKLSGDYNPLHMDENYASTTIFQRRICHGMLLASFFSRLVGMYIPGKNSLYFSQALRFVAPCFIGEEIMVEGEVLEKSVATRIITLKTIIRNNSGKNIVEGEAKIIVRM